MRSFNWRILERASELHPRPVTVEGISLQLDAYQLRSGLPMGGSRSGSATSHLEPVVLLGLVEEWLLHVAQELVQMLEQAHDEHTSQ